MADPDAFDDERLCSHHSHGKVPVSPVTVVPAKSPKHRAVTIKNTRAKIR